MRSIWLMSLLLLAACVRAPSISPDEADAVQAAAQKLLEDAAGAPITADRLPSGIGALKPNSVRVAPEGVYIETSSRFVEEVGIFVPRHPEAFTPARDSDPAYERIHGNVFSYRIRG